MRSHEEITRPAAGFAGRPWLLLGAILIAVLPTLVIGTRERLSTHTMENVALVTSQETWLRLAEGDQRAWLVSTNDGKPRLEKPPMLTWLNLLAWSGLDPETASPQELTFRARLVTAVLGVLMLAAIFWITATLVDPATAGLAALAVGSTFFFQRQARTASYDMHYVAWTTIAVAAGVWAMHTKDVVPSLSRRALGWGMCGIALAAAAMSKNPLPYLLAVPALIAAVVLLSRSKRIDGLVLAGVTLASAVPVAAWYWHVFAEYREVAEAALQREVRQPRAGDFQEVYYYLGLFGLIVPWTLWLIGGLIEPFKMPKSSRRRAAFLALFWFTFIFIALSIPAAKQQRYILAALPAAGMLIAIFLRQHEDRAAAGVHDRLFVALHAGIWLALGCASIASTGFFGRPVQVFGWFGSADHETPIAALPLALAIAVAIVLASLCVVGWRWRQCRPMSSALICGAWMLIFMSVFWRQEAQVPSPRVQPLMTEAQRVRSLVGESTVVSLRWIDTLPGGWDWKLNEEFRFYFGRLLPRIVREEFDHWLAEQEAGAYVLVRKHEEAADYLAQQGLVRIDSVLVDDDDPHELWQVR